MLHRVLIKGWNGVILKGVDFDTFKKMYNLKENYYIYASFERSGRHSKELETTQSCFTLAR